MIAIKPGVRVIGLRQETVIGILITYSVFEEYGYDLILTGGTEDGHSTIAHPTGIAWDVRTKHLPASVDKDALRSQIADRLGDNYDFLFRYAGEAQEHFHGEFDPR